MPRSSRRLLAAALGALALLPGCGADPDLLARVGRREIRRDDMVAMARALSARQALPPDSLETHLLDTLIQRELLVLAAEEAGLHRDTLFLDYQRRIAEQGLRERLLGDLAGGDVPVSEAEVVELHRWRDRETRVRALFAFTRPAAEAALLQIRLGGDFGRIADQFNPSGFTPPGGDLGFVAPGYLQQPLDDVVRTGVPGEVYGPIDASPQGWFLVRIEERRPRQREPLEAERALLTEVIRQRKQRRIALRALGRLEAEHEVRVLLGAPQELTARVRSVAPQRAPVLSEGEKALTLATYRGGAYTLGDAIADLQDATQRPPDFRIVATVEQWLKSRAMDRVMLREARTRGYAEEPRERRALRAQLDDYLLQGYFARHVSSAARATEAEGRELYREQGGGARLRAARIRMAATPDSAAAARLVQSAALADDLEAAIAAARLDLATRLETVPFPSDHPIWSPLEPALTALEPGGYGGPYPFPGGWLVLQLVSKEQGTVTFDALPEATRQAYVNQATHALQASRLRALTDSLRTRIPVTVYPERLKNLGLATALAS